MSTLSTSTSLRLTLLFFIVLFTGGLFIGGPDYYDNPIVKELWESGHFLLFLFASFYLYTYSRLNRIEAIRRSVVILTLLLAFGFLAELIQPLVGRNFEAKDLLNDLLGALAGLLIPHLRFKTSLSRFILLVSLFISLVFFSNRPLLSSVIQEIQLQQDFPILSDFETPSQLDRWKDSWSRLSLSDSNVRDGRFSMRVELLPGQYPGVTLKRLHGNWQGYQAIKLSIYLEEKEPINLSIKVYDRQHPDSGFDHNDRFNGKLSLNPEWNDFLLPLDSIKNAPAERSMDMKNIVALSLITVNLKQTITLYIDNVQLVSDL